MLDTPRAREKLARLRDRPLNFDPDHLAEYTPEHGWTVDDYRQPLPPEPPGEPLPAGSFAVVRGLMQGYEFADPRIVRAIFDPDRPLAERTMLLEGRFYGMRFHFGVRVGDVLDEPRTLDGRPARVYGWSYRTLQGHLERGQMDWHVYKLLDTGEVEFRIHAVSKPSGERSLPVRLGFFLFGRWMQLRFVRRTCARVYRLAEQRAVLPEGAKDAVTTVAGGPPRLVSSHARPRRTVLARPETSRP